jgi:hypothetical protein
MAAPVVGTTRSRTDRFVRYRAAARGARPLPAPPGGSDADR